MTYHAPTTLADALCAVRAPGARILAGGTDFYPALGERPVDFDIVDISRLEALRTIETARDGAVRIGACATWSDVARAALPPHFSALQAAAREVGSIQIQNTATLAGNLCNASPAADGVPPLLALDAAVEIAGQNGTRRLPLAEFITGVRRTMLGEGEIVSAIHVPPQPDGTRSAFLKLGARRYLVISIAMVAVTLVPEAGRIAAARVAVGACSAVARRLGALEEALAGAPLAEAAALVAPAHLAALSPIDDIRATAAYRAEAAAEIVCRAITAAARECMA